MRCLVYDASEFRIEEEWRLVKMGIVLVLATRVEQIYVDEGRTFDLHYYMV